MRPFYKGLILAALHLAVVASLGGKLLVDRATRPRVWMRALPYDPNLPIRGRYVRLRVDLQNRMVANSDPARGTFRLLPAPRADYAWDEPESGVAYFSPEDVEEPSRRSEGEELWVEVTLPKKGPPRPIRLAVKRGDTLALLPLD